MDANADYCSRRQIRRTRAGGRNMAERTATLADRRKARGWHTCGFQNFARPISTLQVVGKSPASQTWIGSGDSAEPERYVIRKEEPITGPPKGFREMVSYPKNLAKREHWIRRDAGNPEQGLVSDPLTNEFVFLDGSKIKPCDRRRQRLDLANPPELLTPQGSRQRSL